MPWQWLNLLVRPKQRRPSWTQKKINDHSLSVYRLSFAFSSSDYIRQQATNRQLHIRMHFSTPTCLSPTKTVACQLRINPWLWIVRIETLHDLWERREKKNNWNIIIITKPYHFISISVSCCLSSKFQISSNCCCDVKRKR